MRLLHFVSSVRSSSVYPGLLHSTHTQQPLFPIFQIWSNPAVCISLNVFEFLCISLNVFEFLCISLNFFSFLFIYLQFSALLYISLNFSRISLHFFVFLCISLESIAVSIFTIITFITMITIIQNYSPLFTIINIIHYYSLLLKFDGAYSRPMDAIFIW